MDRDSVLYQVRRRWWPLCLPLPDMLTLMRSCCHWVSSLQQPISKVTVLVVGLDNAGKTSTIRGILKGSRCALGPPQGCVRTELLLDNFLITLLEVGGAPEQRRAWRNHYGDAHGIMFVVDSSDRLRLREVKELLADLLKQPKVAGKPILLLANKQDKMNALMGSELIEALSLEDLINQSQSLCHIEMCSALLDTRRWAERRTLRGLHWLLRAVCLDYPQLCARVARDSHQSLSLKEKERRGRAERSYGKLKEDRICPSRTEIHAIQQRKEKNKDPQLGGKLKPIRNILKKESSLKRRLKKKEKHVRIKDTAECGESRKECEDEEVEGTQVEKVQNWQREVKVKSVLSSRNRGKLNRKVKVKEELPEFPDNEGSKRKKGKEENTKKKKSVKAKKKNQINTEEVPAGYLQPVDLSETFDLYRKAILTLKARQDQGR